ncbi:MAG: 3-dehydroquinate synthase [Flammeovirgaceae bacterium]
MLNKVEYFNSLNLSTFEFLKKYTQIGVLVDENTKLHCYPLVKDFLPNHFLIEIPSGEENKHLETCVSVWKKMTDFQFDRKAVLLNLGGGVIGDLGGFCASTYKRGIDFYQIPTTLLAQVDASVGGKLGIDFLQFKNHIGVFNLPKNVLIYPDFIKTLSFRELRSGFAEVLKHCLIADKEEWKNITQKSLQEQNWSEIIPHSVKIKSNIVEQDPKESGLRKILNFGHTIGHAVESYFLRQGIHKKLLHGEAIAVGMIAEAYLSHLKCGLSIEEVNEISAYFLMTYGKILITNSELTYLYDYMLQDKKNEGKSVRFALLPKIGECLFDIEANRSEIEKSLNYYQQL